MGRALQIEGDSPAMDASHAPRRADVAQVAPRRQLHPVQRRAEIGDQSAHAPARWMAAVLSQLSKFGMLPS